jgi:uncharacterized protein YjbJ (UPF0337 family)
MNRIEVKGNWNEQKGRLKQRFAKLTDDNLMFEAGKRDEILGKCQIKLGKIKEEFHRIMSEV